MLAAETNSSAVALLTSTCCLCWEQVSLAVTWIPAGARTWCEILCGADVAASTERAVVS